MEISNPQFLLCDICSTPVYNYELCTQPHTYCSRECYEELVLSQKNDYLDVPHKMKKVDQMCEDETKSNDSWDSIYHAEEYAEMFHTVSDYLKESEK